ncbi:MAG TPA: hypothetical protein VGT79_00280, partial [Xanthomonadaceae bacterium]|nr:hypothetical protein [Xanthomonadaceae bacterium]
MAAGADRDAGVSVLRHSQLGRALVRNRAIIGFPFAMLFSWFYEWTPQGIVRESEVAPDESITRQTGRKMDRWIIAVLGLAVVLLLANTFVLHKDENAAAIVQAP